MTEVARGFRYRQDGLTAHIRISEFLTDVFYPCVRRVLVVPEITWKVRGIAMSAELFRDLQTLVRDGSNRQNEVLGRITDLFVARASEYTGDQAALFGTVFTHLMNHVESRALAELSTRLAPIETAPNDVIQRLAKNDRLDVSGPVLAESAALTDDDLTQIVITKSQGHLSKIAGRPALSEKVTDALVDHGEADVVNQVANNRGARFSEIGTAKLVMRADGDNRLTLSLGRRLDIPRRQFRQLLAQATDVVRQKLLASADPKHRDALAQILDALAAQVGHKTQKSRDYTAAKRVVSEFSQDTGLLQSKILEFADAGRLAETIVALSLLSEVPIQQIERLFNGTEAFGLMVLCKAVGLDWTTAHAVLVARATEQKSPDQTFDEAREQYGNLSMPSAHKILHFWREHREADGQA